mmetsp:Transcript_28321/g.51270  ORF Transcript_28321/g.51270 Transcript_28321/m.51270 type:complete len:261 (+) Transcript_28321:728-1510(+)
MEMKFALEVGIRRRIVSTLVPKCQPMWNFSLFQVMRIRTWCSRPTFTRAAASQYIQTGRQSLPRIALLPTRLWSISTMLRRPVLLVSMWHSLTASVQGTIKLQRNFTMRPESRTLTSTLPTVDATAMRRVHQRFLPRRHQPLASLHQVLFLQTVLPRRRLLVPTLVPCLPRIRRLKALLLKQRMLLLNLLYLILLLGQRLFLLRRLYPILLPHRRTFLRFNQSAKILGFLLPPLRRAHKSASMPFGTIASRTLWETMARR